MNSQGHLNALPHGLHQHLASLGIPGGLPVSMAGVNSAAMAQSRHLAASAQSSGLRKRPASNADDDVDVEVKDVKSNHPHNPFKRGEIFFSFALIVISFVRSALSIKKARKLHGLIGFILADCVESDDV